MQLDVVSLSVAGNVSSGVIDSTSTYPLISVGMVMRAVSGVSGQNPPITASVAADVGGLAITLGVVGRARKGTPRASARGPHFVCLGGIRRAISLLGRGLIENPTSPSSRSRVTSTLVSGDKTRTASPSGNPEGGTVQLAAGQEVPWGQGSETV